MPRYNITLSSAHEERSPSTTTTWAQTDTEAKAIATQRLNFSRINNQGRPLFDQWEVWQGYARNLPHRKVARGDIAGEQ